MAFTNQSFCTMIPDPGSGSLGEKVDYSLPPRKILLLLLLSGGICMSSVTLLRQWSRQIRRDAIETKERSALDWNASSSLALESGSNVPLIADKHVNTAHVAQVTNTSVACFSINSTGAIVKPLADTKYTATSTPMKTTNITTTASRMNSTEAKILPIAGKFDNATEMTKKSTSASTTNNTDGIFKTAAQGENATTVSPVVNTTATFANNAEVTVVNETRTTHQPSDNYCIWKPKSSECFNLLSQRIRPPQQKSSPKRWVFFGDSTMKFLSLRVMNQVNPSAADACGCRNINAPRCNMYDDFGLTKKKEKWTYPVNGTEGPCRNGLWNPHCQDCAGCYSTLFHCQKTPCDHTTMSFIGVEFARDVIMQTNETNTTQETVALYLRNQQCLQYPFVCVVNTGFHDMMLYNITDARYITNLEWYLTLLQPCCRHLVWIHTTATTDDPQYPQTNARIEKWNAMVGSMLVGENFYNWTTIIDTYAMSTSWAHADNVHLHSSYYVQLAQFFARISEL